MCQVIGVTRSGYYAWKTRQKGEKKKEAKELVKKVKEIFEKSRKTYGSRKISRELKRQGKRVNRKKVQRIMQEEKIVPITVRKYKATTNSRHNFPVAENLIKKLKIERLNQVWVVLR